MSRKHFRFSLFFFSLSNLSRRDEAPVIDAARRRIARFTCQLESNSRGTHSRSPSARDRSRSRSQRSGRRNVLRSPHNCPPSRSAPALQPPLLRSRLIIRRPRLLFLGFVPPSLYFFSRLFPSAPTTSRRATQYSTRRDSPCRSPGPRAVTPALF